MYGWRAKIGIMVPSINTIMEPEIWTMAPHGVSIHAARMYIVTTKADELSEMANETERAARELGTAECDVILYGCTSGSFVHGPAWEADLVRKIEETSGAKALTASGALSRALKAFPNVKKISVATPYVQELVELEDKFFSSLGYEVVKAAGLGLSSGLDIDKIMPESNYTYAKSVVQPDTDLLIISCTDFRSIEIIRDLEQDLGIPVISSNQACMWAALRDAGIQDRLTQYGSLFEH